MRPLFETILESVPAPSGDPDAPLQLQISALDYSSYVGRLGSAASAADGSCPGRM